MSEQERLRASQDKDLSDIGEKLRVQHELIQSLADTQSEHTALLNKHTALLDRHTALHKSHQGDLARIKLDLARLQGGVEQIIGMLHTSTERDQEL